MQQEKGLLTKLISWVEISTHQGFKIKNQFKIAMEIQKDFTGNVGEIFYFMISRVSR